MRESWRIPISQRWSNLTHECFCLLIYRAYWYMIHLPFRAQIYSAIMTWKRAAAIFTEWYTYVWEWKCNFLFVRTFSNICIPDSICLCFFGDLNILIMIWGFVNHYCVRHLNKGTYLTLIIKFYTQCKHLKSLTIRLPVLFEE